LDDALYNPPTRRRKHSSSNTPTLKCDDCMKEFRRPCDLTKHAKTHSRPWKCTEPGCKYYDLGWPTEKERDRHWTDRHSNVPTLYECRSHPCTYKSKRESNLKQHMMKKHGWDYDRKEIGSFARARRTNTPVAFNSTESLSLDRNYEGHIMTREDLKRELDYFDSRVFHGETEGELDPHAEPGNPSGSSGDTVLSWGQTNMEMKMKKRQGSRSDSKEGLIDLMLQQGGPSTPTVASSSQENDLYLPLVKEEVDDRDGR